MLQYDERFAHRAAWLGVLAQWQLAPGWTLEGDIASGHLWRAHMRAPQLAFSQSLGSGRPLWRAGVQLAWQLHPRISLAAGWQWQRAAYGASAVQATPSGDLQVPDSRFTHSSASLALRMHF